MHQFNVKDIFLHSLKGKKVYLKQPLEYVKRESDEEKLVCWLKRSTYGLKRAASNWYRNDHCLFAKTETDCHIFILVWDIDIIVASRRMTVISEIKTALKATMDMEDWGKLRLKEGKFLSERKSYIDTKLEWFQ